MLDVGNFFAIKEAKERAKNGTGSGSGSGNKNLPFMTVMIDGNGARGVDRDVVRNKVNIVVASRVLSSIKNYLELGFGEEGNCKALVLELLEGVKEDGDAAVHGSDSVMEDCVN